VLPNVGGSLPNDIFSEGLGLPTIWVPHSYPGCSQHAPNEHLLAPVARDGLRKRSPQMRRPERWFVGNVNGLGGWFFRYLFTNQVQYARAGLDARQARRLARNSPHRREAQVTGFAPLAEFLDEVGLLGPIARRAWKRTKFL